MLAQSPEKFYVQAQIHHISISFANSAKIHADYKCNVINVNNQGNKVKAIDHRYVVADVKYLSWKILRIWSSLVAQWLRIRLSMQGTQVWALAREDPICHRATKPVCHNYWACALELVSHNYWAHVPQLLKPTHLEPMLRNKRSHRNEKHAHCNEEQPPLAATRESPRAAMKTQSGQK